MLAVATALLADESTPDAKLVKYGSLTHDEIWQGDVYIIGDVTIPDDVSVTVSAGTQLHFADYDLFKTGADPDRCEIIVHGRFFTDASVEQPIHVETLDRGNSLSKLAMGEHTQVIKFKPYVVDTESMRQEFRGFKNQYLVLWSLIYAMWIMR